MTRALYVLKLGSGTVFSEGGVFDEIARLAGRGARVLVVSGGALAIERHYASLGREVKTLRLKNGDGVRYCPPAEMGYLAEAYERIVLPELSGQLARRGLSAYAALAGNNALVQGAKNRPLRVREGDRERIVRDHRAGVVIACDAPGLLRLLESHQVVCLTPPILDGEDGGWLNIDADMLAARIFNDLKADHLRFVTSTPGILRDVADPASVVRELYPGEEASFIVGRMKQKLRAAEAAALGGVGDVAITGPHSFLGCAGRTWFWSAREPSPGLGLLSRSVEIASPSGDESELAEFLAGHCRDAGLRSWVDEAGNFVAAKGGGPRRLLMLGHIDTVPFRWKGGWGPGGLSGRGSVDAKSSLVNFIEALKKVEVPEDRELMVVGAVEEEVSSSKGGFFARDRYPAEAVIIGEPSGAEALTLGYYGLLKLRLCARAEHGHSAGAGAVSAPDLLLRAIGGLRSRIAGLDGEGTSAVIELRSWDEAQASKAEAILNFRVSPGAELGALLAEVESRAEVEISVLRATPGVAFGRASTIARCFSRAFSREGVRARYLVKKGTSDMNTLATTWKGIPMVAYGPGDSSLDHTTREVISAEEFGKAARVLIGALKEWLGAGEPQ